MLVKEVAPLICVCRQTQKDQKNMVGANLEKAESNEYQVTIKLLVQNLNDGFHNNKA